jgi:hypothetical protein
MNMPVLRLLWWHEQGIRIAEAQNEQLKRKK